MSHNRDPPIHLLLVGDSRVNSFDRYRPPEGFRLHIDYVIRRGATVADLIPPTLRKLSQYGSSDWVVLRFAAGINDLTEFTDYSHKRVLWRSSIDANQLISRLKHFQESILRHHPNCIISFVTIPTASFTKYQASKNLNTPVLSSSQLKIHQHDLDNQLDTVNSFIQEFNSAPQAGIPIPLKHLHWHSYIRRPTKRRNYSGRITKAIVRNRFPLLYDGLHAVSTVKQRWFAELCRAFQEDHRTVLQHLT